MEKTEINILQLSDLHIGKDLGSGHKHFLWKEKDKDKLETNDSNFKSKESQLPELIKQWKYDFFRERNIDFVILTGDLVLNGANEDEHKKAFKVLKKILNELNFKNLNNVFIIPGNHDISRKDENFYNNFHYKYHNKFHKNDPTHVYDNNMKIGNTKKCFKKNVIFRRTRRIGDKNIILNFIPLQSQGLYSDNDWKYDRGFIEQDQIRKIEIKKDLLKKPALNIAFFHHNPIPINNSENKYSDEIRSNLLSNGLEVLTDLSECGIQVYLHGHYHKGSHFELKNADLPYNNSSYIIGCPTFGHPSTEDNNGFSLISISPNNNSFQFAINRYYLKDRKIIPPKINRFNLMHNEVNLFNSYYSFEEGVIKLQKHLLENPPKNITMFHYQMDTSWNNAWLFCWKCYIEELLEEDNITILNDVQKNKLNSIIDEEKLPQKWLPNIEKLFLKADLIEGQTVKFNLINSLILSSTLKGFIDFKSLIRCFKSGGFRDFMQIIINSFVKEDVEFLCDDHNRLFKKKENRRYLNYLLEPINCAIDENRKIDKFVYFDINADKSVLFDKFIWFLNSILSANTLSNYNIQWMPFSINGFSGESIISMSNENPKYGDSITFAGYKNTKSNIPNVICIDSKENIIPIEKYLNALLKKAIFPLSYKLECLFPVFFEGKLNKDLLDLLFEIFIDPKHEELNTDNLEKYILICDTIDLIKQTLSLSDKLYDKKIFINNINSLQHWVFDPCIHEKNYWEIDHKRYAFPWDKNNVEDIEKVIKSLKLENEN